MDIGEHNQIVKDELRAKIKELEAEVDKLLKWVHDLQSGMFINCVYCGHRYGPNDEIPATMADILKEHVEQCPKHPMSALKAERDELRAAIHRNATMHTDGRRVVFIFDSDEESKAFYFELLNLRQSTETEGE